MSEKEGSSLDDRPFSYRRVGDGTVLISYHGRMVTTLRGKDADRFLAKVVDADDQTAQMAMAKVTGNFKRGNERQAGNADKNRPMS